MGGRKWTDEELVLLEELTEKYPLETVARRLNRTKEAVFLKRQRIGMGGYMANTDMLTRNTVSKILGIENRTLQYWERKGLKSYRKRPYVMYRQEDIIKYMREHPEDWNAARVTDDTMFMRYNWYKEKRKNDISGSYTHLIGMVQVEGSDTWLTQEEYEQMCKERDAYKAAEQAEEQSYYNAILQSTETPVPTTTAAIGSLDWDADDSYRLAKIAMAEAEDVYKRQRLRGIEPPHAAPEATALSTELQLSLIHI